jgi:hypothetical protein
MKRCVLIVEVGLPAMLTRPQAKLRGLDRDNPLARRQIDEGVSYAVLPSQFIRTWKAWVKKPLTDERPTKIDNSTFICEHDNLRLDLNVETDLLDQQIALVYQSEWDILSSL